MLLNSGFNLTEALNLVALSAIVEGGDAPPQPVGWSMAFDSPLRAKRRRASRCDGRTRRAFEVDRATATDARGQASHFSFMPALIRISR
jgi:hypothetical protein